MRPFFLSLNFRLNNFTGSSLYIKVSPKGEIYIVNYLIQLLTRLIAIISKPSQYEDSMALLRSCLDQLEKIAIQKLPGAIQSTTKTKSPPPVPPKPSLIHQKPTIPPRPKKVITPNDINVSKRSRGNSVSFAGVQQNTIIENDELPETINKTDETGTVMIEEDDDDDDDVVIEFENSKP